MLRIYNPNAEVVPVPPSSPHRFQIDIVTETAATLAVDPRTSSITLTTDRVTARVVYADSRDRDAGGGEPNAFGTDRAC